MFIFNHDMTALVNTEHIVKMEYKKPELSQTYHIIVAKMTYGTEIMYQGTEKGCFEYLESMNYHG